MSDPLLLLAYAAAVFLLAGGVKGVVGLGLPTVAMGLLGLAMPPVEAAALLVLPSLVTNLQQSCGPHLGPLLRRLWPLLAASALGVWLGGDLLARNGEAARPGLGLALLAYGLLGLAGPRLSLPPPAERWAGPATGLATGLVTAATGVFVLPAVPYLQALGLERDRLVQAMGLSFAVSTLALGLQLGSTGALSEGLLVPSLVGLAAAVAGMALGARLRRRLRPETFRRWLFIGLIALGLQLLLQGLS